MALVDFTNVKLQSFELHSRALPNYFTFDLLLNLTPNSNHLSLQEVAHYHFGGLMPSLAQCLAPLVKEADFFDLRMQRKNLKLASLPGQANFNFDYLDLVLHHQ